MRNSLAEDLLDEKMLYLMEVSRAEQQIRLPPMIIFKLDLNIKSVLEISGSDPGQLRSFNSTARIIVRNLDSETVIKVS